LIRFPLQTRIVKMPFICRSGRTILRTLIVSLILLYFGTYDLTKLGHANSSVTTHSTGAELTFLTTATNRSSLDGAAYSATGYPYSGSWSHILKENGQDDINTSTGGTSRIGDLGFSKDKLSTIVQMASNQTTGTILTNHALKQVRNNHTSQLGAISYTAKFECGSIAGQEGPLRPGHYDTDISVFNRQDYPIRILWKALSANGTGNTTIVPRYLQPQISFSIICKDIRQSLNLENESKELVEGFVLIRIDLSPDLVNSLLRNIGSLDGQTSVSSDPMNLLDVQVFYTANALESLPHEVIANKITFSIFDNATLPKIPVQLLEKSLDVTVASQMNEISDPALIVKKILSEKYHLSATEVNELQIRIINVDIGITSTIDDHAISSSTLKPQLSA
jgi:hypothetical protein